MTQHQQPSQATLVQRACVRCGCAHFTGSTGADFCSACGHSAADHPLIDAKLLEATAHSPEIALQTVASTAATVQAPTSTASPRKPLPTAKILNLVGVILIGVVVIAGSTFMLSLLNDRAGDRVVGGEVALEDTQRDLADAKAELEETTAEAEEIARETRQLEKQIANVKRDRARLPRKIETLRAQQRSLNQRIQGATYQPQAR